MFGLFKRDPTKKLIKQISTMQTKAVQVQRSGDLRKYAKMMTEIAQLEEQLIALKKVESE